MGRKIGYGLLGILLISTIVLCFLINLYLGLFILVFSGIVVWWIYGVKKKRGDLAMAKVAKDAGLKFRKDLFKYGTVRGEYKGHETEIGVYTSTDAFGGMGVLLTSLSGEGAFAALEISNFTGIKMRHNLSVEEKKIISEQSSFIAVDKEWAYLILPHVSEDPREIRKGMDRLCEVVENVSR